jgi:hypothetical protein
MNYKQDIEHTLNKGNHHKNESQRYEDGKRINLKTAGQISRSSARPSIDKGAGMQSVFAKNKDQDSLDQ